MFSWNDSISCLETSSSLVSYTHAFCWEVTQLSRSSSTFFTQNVSWMTLLKLPLSSSKKSVPPLRRSLEITKAAAEMEREERFLRKTTMVSWQNSRISWRRQSKQRKEPVQSASVSKSWFWTCSRIRSLAGKSSRQRIKIFKLKKRSSWRKSGKLRLPRTVNQTMETTKEALEVVAEEDVLLEPTVETTDATKGETVRKSTWRSRTRLCQTHRITTIDKIVVATNVVAIRKEGKVAKETTIASQKATRVQPLNVNSNPVPRWSRLRRTKWRPAFKWYSTSLWRAKQPLRKKRTPKKHSSNHLRIWPHTKSLKKVHKKERKSVLKTSFRPSLQSLLTWTYAAWTNTLCLSWALGSSLNPFRTIAGNLSWNVSSQNLRTTRPTCPIYLSGFLKASSTLSSDRTLSKSKTYSGTMKRRRKNSTTLAINTRWPRFCWPS